MLKFIKLKYILLKNKLLKKVKLIMLENIEFLKLIKIYLKYFVKFHFLN